MEFRIFPTTMTCPFDDSRLNLVKKQLDIRSETLEKPCSDNDEQQKEDGSFGNHFLQNDDHCAEKSEKIQV
jgi:hypothetical protein